MPERAAVLAVGDVPDDVVRLARVVEGALERVVVVRGDDDLVLRCPAFAEGAGQGGEEAVDAGRCVLAGEELAELVVEWARPLARNRPLRDAQQVERFALRVPEDARQVLRELAAAGEQLSILPVRADRAVAQIDAGPEQRNDLAIGKRGGDPRVVRLERVGHEVLPPAA